MSTIIDKKLAVKVTNTTETPYLVKRCTQVAAFSVVTLEQYKFIKPVDSTNLTIVTQCDPNLTTYLNELLTVNKPEQQSHTFWVPTPKNPGKTDDQTPIETRTLSELHELEKRGNKAKKLTQNSKRNFLNYLIARTHCLRKLKNKQLKTFWLSNKTLLPDRKGHSDEHAVRGEIHTERP